MDKYIHLTNTVRIKNPCNKGFFYQGPIQGYSFNTQQSNFDQISKKLYSVNKFLTTIYVGKYPAKHHNNLLTCFLALSDDKSVAWYKYEGNTNGGGQNMIYINGKKIKTTHFLSLDESGVKDLF